MNLATLPDLRATDNPDGVCIADDRYTFTNDEFLCAVQRAAAALHASGVAAGDVVALIVSNQAGFVVALFAAWHLGATVTPVNPTLVEREVVYQLTDSGATAVVVERPLGFEVPARTVLSVEDLTTLDAGDPPAAADTAGTGLALLIYTSGSTGRPKGVMLDHANLHAMCEMIIEAFALGGADHSLLILPLFHVNGIVIGTLAPLLAGGRTTIAGRFDVNSFFDRVQQSRPTYFSAVPTIYTMLAGLPTDVTPDTSSLRFAVCGAAPASVELLAKFENRYHVALLEGYGLSEGTCASAVNPLRGTRKAGTVGIALPGQTLRIVDADGTELPVGQPGEVLIHGPNVTRGYLNMPAETARTVIDGWLHTGDVGYLDEDGYLVLVDRAKDMIIRGGENIYPKEIENLVYQMPEVAEAAVVGRPSSVYGEEPVLFVSLNAAHALSIDQIRDHVQRHLAKFKWPVDITILGDVPKNPVGKVDKPCLRRMLADNSPLPVH
jgi:long-chain acyl-CoA synthetase